MIVAKGLLMRYAKNDVIWVPPARQGRDTDVDGGDPCDKTGIFIVIAGLVSRSFKEADGKKEVRSRNIHDSEVAISTLRSTPLI